MVRQRRYVEGPDEYNHLEREAYDGDNHSALLKASRELRVAAVAVIPELIDALKAEAERVIAQVEKAKKIADSLK